MSLARSWLLLFASVATAWLAMPGPARAVAPGGSVAPSHEEASIWEEYRWPLAASIGLVTFQAGLIVALVAQLRFRRRAERQLLETEQHMRMATAATGVGLWMSDSARGTSWANREHRSMLGLGDDAEPSLAGNVDRVSPEDRAHVAEEMDRVMARGGDYEVQFRVRPRDDGDVRWVTSRGRVNLDARGRPASARGATVDVTARVQADIQAEVHRNELAHLSRVVLLGQLSGSIAHELNQPLTAILSNAQAALRFLQAPGVDLDGVNDILRDIVADDRRAGEIIRRLRALFERGEAKSEPVDVNAAVVREVARLLRSELVSRNVAVTMNLDPRLPPARGDRVQLQQVLLNLVFNACEAMAAAPAGSRSLTLRTALAGPGHVGVYVSDAGPGIPPDQLDAIFEPFVSSKPFGIGLGLVISRSIVSAHGGELQGFNNEGRGATFGFTVPVASAGTVAAPTSTADATPTGYGAIRA